MSLQQRPKQVAIGQTRPLSLAWRLFPLSQLTYSGNKRTFCQSPAQLSALFPVIPMSPRGEQVVWRPGSLTTGSRESYRGVCPSKNKGPGPSKVIVFRFAQFEKARRSCQRHVGDMHSIKTSGRFCWFNCTIKWSEIRPDCRPPFNF